MSPLAETALFVGGAAAVVVLIGLACRGANRPVYEVGDKVRCWYAPSYLPSDGYWTDAWVERIEWSGRAAPEGPFHYYVRPVDSSGRRTDPVVYRGDELRRAA